VQGRRLRKDFISTLQISVFLRLLSSTTWRQYQSVLLLSYEYSTRECSDCGHQVSSSALKCLKGGKLSNTVRIACFLSALFVVGLFFWHATRPTQEAQEMQREDRDFHLALCDAINSGPNPSVPENCKN